MPLIIARAIVSRSKLARNGRMPSWIPVVPLALLLSACGGDGDSAGLAPVLRVGMQRQYTGSSTRSVVYANPTASSPNNTLTYNFTENQSVQASAGNAPADYDVHTDYAYTVVADPGTGSVPISQSVDSFQNLVVSGDSQMTVTVAQNTVAVSNDESADALSGGPYTETTTTTASFPTVRTSFSYPLKSGATMNVPQSSTANIAFTDADASGAAPPDGSNVGYTRTRTEGDDGSVSYQNTSANGNTEDLTQGPDGSGNYTATSATSATATTTVTLALPVTTGGMNSLPITRSTMTAATGASTSTDYTAADWYPNDGAPDAPLVLQAQTVIGPTDSLPADCQGALLRPDIYEIDTSTTSQSTINASYSVTKTQSFNADGVTVCSLSQATAYAYELLTGTLSSTTTTTTTTVLNAINY